MKFVQPLMLYNNSHEMLVVNPMFLKVFLVDFIGMKINLIHCTEV